MQHKQLSELLAAIRAKLLSEIPKVVGKRPRNSLAYCLFIWYQDSSVDESAPILGWAPDEMRLACLSGQYGKKLGNEPIHSIWCPQQSIETPFPGYPFPKQKCLNIANEISQCYSILIGGPEPPAKDEGSLLMPIRSMLHGVARELNRINWSETIPVTDDFVVLATDYSGYWLDEDMRASILQPQLMLLKQRGLLPWK